jgi:5-bromo-4-chloroindolyl phosphate hydrolysis protein
MSESMKEFKPNELPPELGQFDHLSAMVDAAGRNRIYGVDEEGHKKQLKIDEVYAAYGYTEEDYPETPDEWEKLSDIEKLSSHAKWSQELQTSRTTKEDLKTTARPGKTVKASENGLTPDDFAYNATLEEMFEESKNNGRTLSQKVKDDKETKRISELRKLANLRMRVKTGNLEGLTADDIEYVMNQIDEEKKSIRPNGSKPETSEDEKNPFESAPELSSRRVDQNDINNANYKLEEAVANGDEKAFAEAEKFLANEVNANEMITGVKGVEAFNNMVANKRKELEENKQKKDRNLIPFDINQDKRLTDEQRKIMKDKWNEQTASVAEPLPEIVEQTPVAPVVVPPIPPAPASSDKEKSGLKRKIVLAGLGVLAAAGLIAGANYVDDNYIDKDKTEAPSGAGDDNDGQPSADDLRGSGALDGNGSPDAEAPTSAQVEAIEKAVDERTGELSDIDGSTPWSRANEAYGDNATPRLISAVEALQADGVDAQWHGNPNTDTNAWISIDGNSETDYVWNRLAQVLGQQDVESFLTAQAELPATE